MPEPNETDIIIDLATKLSPETLRALEHWLFRQSGGKIEHLGKMTADAINYLAVGLWRAPDEEKIFPEGKTFTIDYLREIVKEAYHDRETPTSTA